MRLRLAGGALAAVACAGSIAATLPGALHYSFWIDEFASAGVILEPTPSGVLRHVVRRESTPPGWYLLAWSGHEIGISVQDLRLFSVAFAAALAGLTVVYAKQFVSLAGAALAGLLVALGGEFFRHGWELRAYALFALLCLVFAVVLERAAASPRPARLLALAGAVVLGSLTHYFFLFTLLAGLIWLWLPHMPRSARWRASAAIGLGLVPFLIWSPEFVHQASANHTVLIGRFTITKLEEVYPQQLATGVASAAWQRIGLRVAIIALVLWGSTLLLRRGGRAALCALLAVTPLLLASLLSIGGAKIFVTRNLLGTGPFAAVAIAAALETIPRRSAAVAVTAAACGLGMYGFVAARAVPPTPFNKIAAALVTEEWTGKAPIAFMASKNYPIRAPLHWYLPGHPHLMHVVPTQRPCRSVYLIVVGSGPLALLDNVTTIHITDKLRVARLPWRGALWHELAQKKAHLLAWPTAHPACVRRPRL